MALVFLTSNGVGLGHLVRATTVCRVLESVGERPIIFAQGIFPLDDGHHQPGRRVPSLWPADDAVRRQITGDIRSMVELSLPAVLVEDTHPSPVLLPKHVRRVLMVRPTTFAYLTRLHDDYAHVYSAFLLCDSPGSPTWPYSEDQTDQILRWDKWNILGPVYRSEATADIEHVRTRYGMEEAQRLFVFTMGGGGQHRPSDSDAREFVAFAAGVADELLRDEAGTRLIFVKGPYFSSGVAVDGRFEIVRHEPRLPTLLSLADGAVIRFGFNTIWECLAAGTPFWPFIGTTFDEPTRERLARLRDHGLLADDLPSLANDPLWREQFRQACGNETRRFPGAPDGRLLTQLIMDRPHQRRPKLRVVAQSPGTLVSLARRFRGAVRRVRHTPEIPLIIRIDDVVSIDATVDWLLRLLVGRSLHASLEIIPYLVDFDERLLDAYDPEVRLFEVSQHGYAHVPRSGSDRRRYEFDTSADAPTVEEVRDIRRGCSILNQKFASRFTRGFSAPFDALPRWLPTCWRDAGGVFVSALAAKHVTSVPIPVVQAGWDVWDWPRDRPQARVDIMREMKLQARTHGHAGIALHPRCLRSRIDRAQLVSLLDFLQDRGFASTSLQARV